MKNYITINQNNFIQISKMKSIKVDAIDGILFDWIQNFTKSGKALKKLIDNKLFIWVSYKAIREDNPLCNINSNDVVGRRLNKLVSLGVLEKYLSKEDGNKTFYSITEYAYMYLLENRELPTQESEALPTQESDNSKLDNTSSVDYDEYKNLWNEFATKHNKTKVAKLTAVRKKQIATRLKDYSNFLEIFKYVLIKSEKSDFLLESDFFKLDWLIKNDNNIIKVYEGDYDNRKPKEVIIWLIILFKETT